MTYEESVNFHRPNAFTISGILKVSGPQLLRASRPQNGVRPTTFESKPGDQVMLETWEREGDFPAPDMPIARQLDGQWRLVKRVTNGRPYDLSVRGFRMQISGGVIVSTFSTIKSGRLILEKGSNRLVVDQFNPQARILGLIDLDPATKTLKIRVNTYRESRQPLDFPTGPDVADKLRVFKKDNVKGPRPR